MFVKFSFHNTISIAQFDKEQTCTYFKSNIQNKYNIQTHSNPNLWIFSFTCIYLKQQKSR